VTPVSGSRSFPAWAILGLAVGALLVLSGIVGMVVSRARR
jgi:hypothetical protein